MDVLADTRARDPHRRAAGSSRFAHCPTASAERLVVLSGRIGDLGILGETAFAQARRVRGSLHLSLVLQRDGGDWRIRQCYVSEVRPEH